MSLRELEREHAALERERDRHQAAYSSNLGHTPETKAFFDRLVRVGRSLDEARVKAAIVALKKKGIKLSISACGCCDGAHVSLEVDGKLILDEHSDTHIDMFK